MEKTMAPMKNARIETSDFSQPQGLLSGWLEAPRPRKMVLPMEVSSDDLMGANSAGSYRFACPGSRTRHCRHCYRKGPSGSRARDTRDPRAWGRGFGSIGA